MNINILRYSHFDIAGGQEVDRNFLKFMIREVQFSSDGDFSVLPSHGKRSYLHFFQNLFFIFCIVFTFSNMSEKISLLGSV